MIQHSMKEPWRRKRLRILGHNIPIGAWTQRPRKVCLSEFLAGLRSAQYRWLQYLQRRKNGARSWTEGCAIGIRRGRSVRRLSIIRAYSRDDESEPSHQLAFNNAIIRRKGYGTILEQPRARVAWAVSCRIRQRPLQLIGVCGEYSHRAK